LIEGHIFQDNQEILDLLSLFNENQAKLEDRLIEFIQKASPSNTRQPVLYNHDADEEEAGMSGHED